MKDYYKVLGVDEKSSLAIIKSAYRKLGKENHPDQNKSKNAKRKLIEIKEAYKVLSDDIKRKEYDNSRKNSEVVTDEVVVKAEKKESKKSKEEVTAVAKNDKLFRTIATVIGVIALIGGLFLISELAGKEVKDTTPKKGLTSASYSEFEVAVMSDTKSVVLVASPTCSWCTKFKPILQKVVAAHNIDIMDLDVSKFDSADQTNYLKIDTDSAANGIGTPMLFIVGNGEIIDRIDGYVEQDVVEKFLKENEIIAS